MSSQITPLPIPIDKEEAYDNDCENNIQDDGNDNDDVIDLDAEKEKNQQMITKLADQNANTKRNGWYMLFYLGGILIANTVINILVLNLYGTYSSIFLSLLAFIANACEWIVGDMLMSRGFGCEETNTPTLVLQYNILVFLNASSCAMQALSLFKAPNPIAISYIVITLFRNFQFLCNTIIMMFIGWRYLKNPNARRHKDAIIRLYVVVFLFMVSAYGYDAGSAFPSDLARILWILISLGTAFTNGAWALMYDTYYELIHDVDYSNDVAVGIVMILLYTTAIVGGPFMLDVIRLITSGLWLILYVILFICIFYGCMFFGATRYLSHEHAAAAMFCVQLLINFLLDFIFINSESNSYEFWVLLFITTVAHAIKNLGWVEDISEWIRLKARYSKTVRQIIEKVSNLMYEFGFVKIKPSWTALGMQKISTFESFIFLCKVQGEIVQMITPIIVILALVIDMLFTTYIGGRGSISYGMVNKDRWSALFVYAITFSLKVAAFMITRGILECKSHRLTRILEALQDGDSKKSGEELLAEIEYAKSRLRIIRLYGISFLVNSKDNVGALSEVSTVDGGVEDREGLYGRIGGPAIGVLQEDGDDGDIELNPGNGSSTGPGAGTGSGSDKKAVGFGDQSQKVTAEYSNNDIFDRPTDVFYRYVQRNFFFLLMISVSFCYYTYLGVMLNRFRYDADGNL